ncbi:MAG: VOC family protein [Acidobacteria bacterium]|nr:VOC family protein [Acidobacteriota bacterium]MCI0718440.1 VOC family protein [Acidobacteriota bacterium]
MSQATKSQIDPLNRNNYGAVTAMLTVTDVEKAYEFCQKAFGFEGRGVMPGPDGKPIHAELKLRDSALMLGPENQAWQASSAKTLGNTPATLYLYVEDVDKSATQAANAGATLLQPPTDMFWGDRTATLVDPEGNKWMLATHKSEPTPEQMEAEMKKQCAQMGQAK